MRCIGFVPETESRETLDEAIRVFREIYDCAKKDAPRLHEAPVHAYIRRPDEVQAARKPVLRYFIRDDS